MILIMGLSLEVDRNCMTICTGQEASSIDDDMLDKLAGTVEGECLSEILS